MFKIFLLLSCYLNLARAMWLPTETIQPSNTSSPYEGFGHSVSLYGDKLAVGAAYSDFEFQDSGAVYIFEWNGTSWDNYETFIRPTLSNIDDRFGSNLILYNNTLVVAAPRYDGILSNSGAVYTFTWNGTNWNEDDSIISPNTLQSGTVFGSNMALWGDFLAVGNIYMNSINGNVYTYYRSGNTWVQDTTILTNPYATGTAFGTVTMYGNKLAIGAQSYDSQSFTNEGQVLTYQRIGNEWIIDNEIISNPLPGIRTFFGFRLIMHDIHIAIADNVAIHTYNWNGTQWIYNGEHTSYDPQAFLNFGANFDIYNNKMVISSPADDTFGENSGALYSYDWDGTQWVQDVNIFTHPAVNPGNGISFSSSIYNNKLITSSPNEDSGKGIVYTFEYAPPTPQPTKSPTQTPTESPTQSPTATPTPQPTKAPTILSCPICINDGVCVNFKCLCQYPYYGETCELVKDCMCDDITQSPTQQPTTSPTMSPSFSPTLAPTRCCELPERPPDCFCGVIPTNEPTPTP